MQEQLLLDVLRRLSPDMTIGEFLATVEGITERDECCRCNKPISSMHVRHGELVWRHDDAARSRGCRAASFDGDGWDDTIPRNTYAAPKSL